MRSVLLIVVTCADTGNSSSACCAVKLHGTTKNPPFSRQKKDPADFLFLFSPPATTSPSASTVVSTPQSLETLSYEQNVDIHVDKQRPDASIHLIFNGGNGEDYVQNIMMRVTRSDGTVEEKYINDGIRRPRPYDELVIDGTRGIDQVAVFLTSLGKTYKIFDKPLAYP